MAEINSKMHEIREINLEKSQLSHDLEKEREINKTLKESLKTSAESLEKNKQVISYLNTQLN